MKGIGPECNNGAGGNPSRVLVCQHGARHRYAIPRMLNDLGLLCAFYTDTSEKRNSNFTSKTSNKRSFSMKSPLLVAWSQRFCN